jgi:hypothetical protein
MFFKHQMKYKIIFFVIINISLKSVYYFVLW